MDDTIQLVGKVFHIKIYIAIKILPLVTKHMNSVSSIKYFKKKTTKIFLFIQKL